MRYNDMSMNKKCKVLLIDDDRFLIDMYKVKFERDGTEVELVTNAEEALSKLRSASPPAIIVLDVILPGMDGFELLEVIRREKLAPAAAVIMLTNESDTTRLKQEMKNLNINGYIVKANLVPTEVVAKIWEIADMVTK